MQETIKATKTIKIWTLKENFFSLIILTTSIIKPASARAKPIKKKAATAEEAEVVLLTSGIKPTSMENKIEIIENVNDKKFKPKASLKKFEKLPDFWDLTFFSFIGFGSGTTSSSSLKISYSLIKTPFTHNYYIITVFVKKTSALIQ